MKVHGGERWSQIRMMGMGPLGDGMMYGKVAGGKNVVGGG